MTVVTLAPVTFLTLEVGDLALVLPADEEEVEAEIVLVTPIEEEIVVETPIA